MTLKPGEWAIAGDAGPEPVFAGRGGATIIPFSKGRPAAGLTQIKIDAPTYIDMRGATQDAAKQMQAAIPSILDARDARLETRIIEGIRRRRYDLG
jgi:hypothetical protein